MDLGLAGRTAVVTGASKGLGLGCARALAAEGVRVAIVSRDRDRLEAVAARLPSDTVVATADVSDHHQLAAACDLVETALGQVDIVIANAGGPPPGNFEATDVDAYRGALDLNLLPTVALCKRFIPAMQTRGWGRVVAVTSIAVREPIAHLILSNTARAGLTGFLKTTAREVAAHGVTVNSIQPGLHRTARLEALYADVDAVAKTLPSGTFGDPDDFGRIAAFLCSDAAKFITGAAIPVDGGASHGLQ